MTDVPIHPHVKPAMHPATIKGDSQGAKSARAAMTTLYQAEGKIRDLHRILHNRALEHQRQFMSAMPKPPDGKYKIAPALMYDSNAANHVIDSGTPLAKTALAAADKAIAFLGEKAGQLDGRINLKLSAGKTANDAEIRGYWLAKGSEAFIGIGKLFQKPQENISTIAAVLGGAAYLSGITPANQAALRDVAAQGLAPDEVQARAETSKALGQLETASKSFTDSMATIFNGLKSADVAAIEAITNRGDGS